MQIVHPVGRRADPTNDRAGELHVLRAEHLLCHGGRVAGANEVGRETCPSSREGVGPGRLAVLADTRLDHDGRLEQVLERLAAVLRVGGVDRVLEPLDDLVDLGDSASTGLAYK
jgi:hypothetical protein